MEERFWSKVDKDGPIPTGHEDYEGLGPCWVFNKGGFGMIAFDFSHQRSKEGLPPKISAYRYSYELHNEPIPKGIVVRHRCDNGHLNCVNPDHLVLGTQADNVKDRYRRRRKALVDYFPPEQVDALRTLREKYGVPTRLLAQAANAREQAVKDVLYHDREGTTVPKPKRMKGAPISDEELEEAKRLIVDRGKSIHAAAKQVGRDGRSLSEALKARLGFDAKAYIQAEKEKRNARVVELYREGYSALEVGKQVGLTGPALRKVLEEAGVYEGRGRQGPGKSLPPPLGDVEAT